VQVGLVGLAARGRTGTGDWLGTAVRCSSYCAVGVLACPPTCPCLRLCPGLGAGQQKQNGEEARSQVLV